jgi:hypothetical protein
MIFKLFLMFNKVILIKNSKNLHFYFNFTYNSTQNTLNSKNLKQLFLKSYKNEIKIIINC